MQVDAQPDIYLASASPRRRELLQQLGVRYALIGAGVDETRQDGESPEMYVLRLALEKARAGFQALGDREPRPVLGADTVVVDGDTVLGKPENREQGLAMLTRLGGRTHSVLTAIALVDDFREASRLSVSHVSFRAIDEAEALRYWRTGEPADKAGAYAIQGRAAAFIERLEGSYSGVMGLPLFETAQLLTEFEIDYQKNW